MIYIGLFYYIVIYAYFAFIEFDYKFFIKYFKRDYWDSLSKKERKKVAENILIFQIIYLLLVGFTNATLSLFIE